MKKHITIIAIIALATIGVAILSNKGFLPDYGNYSLITPSGIQRPLGKLNFSDIEWRPTAIDNTIELPFVGNSIVVASRDGDLLWSYHPFDSDGMQEFEKDSDVIFGKEWLAYIPQPLRGSYRGMTPNDRIVVRCPRGTGVSSLTRGLTEGSIRLPSPDGRGGYSYRK